MQYLHCVNTRHTSNFRTESEGLTAFTPMAANGYDDDSVTNLLQEGIFQSGATKTRATVSKHSVGGINHEVHRHLAASKSPLLSILHVLYFLGLFLFKP
jgi:hypothetical protein